MSRAIGLLILLLSVSFAQAREFDGRVTNSEFATLLEGEVHHSVKVEVLSYRFVYSLATQMIRNMTPLMLHNTNYFYRIHLRTPATGPTFVRMICDVVYQNGDSIAYPSNSHFVYFPSLESDAGDCRYWNNRGVELNSSDDQVQSSGLMALSDNPFDLDQVANILERMRQQSLADAEAARVETLESKISGVQYQIRCANASQADRSCFGEIKRSQEAMRHLGLESDSRDAVIKALCKSGQTSGIECRN